MWFEVEGEVFEIDECDVYLIVGRSLGVVDGRVYLRSGRCTPAFLHRLIMENPAGMDVHHADGDRRNNRRYNLQVLTHAEHSRLHVDDRREGMKRRYQRFWESKSKATNT